MHQSCLHCGHEHFVERWWTKSFQQGIQITKTGKADYNETVDWELIDDIIDTDDYPQIFECQHCSSNFCLSPDGNLIHYEESLIS